MVKSAPTSVSTVVGGISPHGRHARDGHRATQIHNCPVDKATGLHDVLLHTFSAGPKTGEAPTTIEKESTAVELILKDMLRRETGDPWPPVPEVCSYAELLDLHRQIIERIEDVSPSVSERGATLNAAAVAVNAVMHQFEEMPPAARNVIPLFVRSVIDAIRGLDKHSNVEPANRLFAAHRWIDHMTAIGNAPQGTTIPAVVR